MSANSAMAEPAVNKLILATGVAPHGFLIETIGGDQVSVEVMVHPGDDPHTFEPSPRQVTMLGQAKIYFLSGLPFERKLVEKIHAAHPGLTIVDLGQGITKLASECDHHDETESTDHDHASSPAEELDPHIWLSPPLLKIQAATLAKALSSADPGQASAYQARAESAMTKLQTLHDQLTARLTPYRGRAFYVFHPAFAYFADAYGLRQKAVEIEGKTPTPKQLQTLIREAKADKVRTIFIQPQFDPRGAQVIAQALGGEVVPLNPEAPNLFENLEATGAAIEKAMTP